MFLQPNMMAFLLTTLCSDSDSLVTATLSLEPAPRRRTGGLSTWHQTVLSGNQTPEGKKEHTATAKTEFLISNVLSPQTKNSVFS